MRFLFFWHTLHLEQKSLKQIENFKCIVALNKDQNDVVTHSVADDEKTHTFRKQEGCSNESSQDGVGLRVVSEHNSLEVFLTLSLA